MNAVSPPPREAGSGLGKQRARKPRAGHPARGVCRLFTAESSTSLATRLHRSFVMKLSTVMIQDLGL